jgi:hypothetical protein
LANNFGNSDNKNSIIVENTAPPPRFEFHIKMPVLSAGPHHCHIIISSKQENQISIPIKTANSFTFARWAETRKGQITISRYIRKNSLSVLNSVKIHSSIADFLVFRGGTF